MDNDGDNSKPAITPCCPFCATQLVVDNPYSKLIFQSLSDSCEVLPDAKRFRSPSNSPSSKQSNEMMVVDVNTQLSSSIKWLIIIVVAIVWRIFRIFRIKLEFQKKKKNPKTCLFPFFFNSLYGMKKVVSLFFHFQKCTLRFDVYFFLLSLSRRTKCYTP